MAMICLWSSDARNSPPLPHAMCHLSGNYCPYTVHILEIEALIDPRPVTVHTYLPIMT